MAEVKANPYVKRYMSLFQGLDRAYGTGQGRWIKEKPGRKEFSLHLAGNGPGLGIGPLMDDGKVYFAAIDLDKPQFDKAREFASYLPGPTVIDMSRSGNAHIVAFFEDPIDAWIPRGIMEKAILAAGEKNVEYFPKQDKLRPGMLGNYLNLNYYGDTRPALHDGDPNKPMTLGEFVEYAENHKNSVDVWTKRAIKYGIKHPDDRPQTSEFGEQKVLHRCAEYVLQNRETNPITEGSRAVVYFALAKQFANCALYDREESIEMLSLISDASPDPISLTEIEHMYDNAVRGQYTSTGCDSPLFTQYADPSCPIAHPNQTGGGLEV